MNVWARSAVEVGHPVSTLSPRCCGPGSFQFKLTLIDWAWRPDRWLQMRTDVTGHWSLITSATIAAHWRQEELHNESKTEFQPGHSSTRPTLHGAFKIILGRKCAELTQPWLLQAQDFRYLPKQICLRGFSTLTYMLTNHIMVYA